MLVMRSGEWQDGFGDGGDMLELSPFPLEVCDGRRRFEGETCEGKEYQHVGSGRPTVQHLCS